MREGPRGGGGALDHGALPEEAVDGGLTDLIGEGGGGAVGEVYAELVEDDLLEDWWLGADGALQTELADFAEHGAVAHPLLALLQPVGFGTSYLRIESLMRKFPTHGLQLSALQLISNAGIALLWCALDASGLLSALDGRSGLEAISTFDLSALQEPAVLAGVAYTGLISTALTVLLQTRALGMLPAADSSEIATTASFRRASPPPRHSSPRA